MAYQRPLVLIVDDSRTMRVMIRKFLEEANFSVAEAENGVQALEMYPQLLPDAILLDVEMPKMDGITACAELRKLPDCHYTPIMMLTTRDDPISINKAFEAGATEFSAKPINWDILGHRVRYLIRTGQNFQELQKKQEELNKAHEELELINDKLEERVIERTEQLKKTTEELQTTLDSLRNTQSQLIESEKISMLGDLLESFAREAYTPINTSINVILALKKDRDQIISNSTHHVLNKVKLDNYLNKCNDGIQTIAFNLQRASELIKNFKQLAVDKTTETVTSFNLNDYLQEIIFGLRPLLKKTKLNININCPEDLIVTTYAGIFFRIIMTLVTNSIVHGYEPNQTGTLTFDITTDGNSVTLRYSDTGKGIPKHNLNKIFEPFFTTKVGTENIGLGLYIMHSQITKIMKGTIQYESEPGKGVVFVIIFPKNSG